MDQVDQVLPSNAPEEPLVEPDFSLPYDVFKPFKSSTEDDEASVATQSPKQQQFCLMMTPVLMTPEKSMQSTSLLALRGLDLSMQFTLLVGRTGP